MPPAGVTAGGVAEVVADVAHAGAEPWGEAHFLIARDAAGQTLAVADLAGIEPGQRVRRTLRFPAPPVGPAHTVLVQALEQDVAWFGELRRITFAVQPRPPYAGMQLSTTTFDALAPARLSTTDAITAAAPYRLRAKVIDGSRWGWHAANLWNRNGEPLDNPPPPGIYPECVLYWVRYHGLTGAVLEVGPERRTAITVAGAVSLASQWFHVSQPPRLTSTENFAGAPYRLLATFRDELGFTWETSPGFNNHGQPLTNLPPPGTYQVALQWRRYDGALRVTSAGPVREVTVTITDGPQPVLEVAGVIAGEPVWDDALGDWSAELAVVRHAFSVPAPGILRVRATAVSGGEMLLNLHDGAGTPLRSGSGGLELPVTPGSYALTLTADHETDFAAAAELFPYALAPRLAGTEAVSARVNVPLAVAAVAAPGAAPIEFSAAPAGEPNGLPAGLRLDARTGELSGTPTTPGTYRVWVSARNAAGAAGRWLTVTVVPRYPPVILWQGLEGPESGALRLDWPVVLAARLEAPAAGLAPPTGLLTYTAERIPPGGGDAVPLAVPADLPVTLTALTGEIRVTARYAGDADYEPAARTVSFVVPDRTPPQPPVAAGFQATVVGSTGFALAWAAFADGAGAAGGRPAQGITYEVELDLGVRRITTTVPAVSFNGLAPGSTHHVRVRARDAAGNVSGWLAGGFSVALPAVDPDAGTGPVWLDVNGDGIRDELIPPGPAFGWFAAEAHEDWVRYTEWTWARVPELGLSWTEGWSLYVGGSWQLVPDEQIHEVLLIRPGFHFLARPGYDYTVGWQVAAPPRGAAPRRRVRRRLRDRPQPRGIRLRGGDRAAPRAGGPGRP
ncbi:MAG: putative Ig domain-containing protein, partial [Opitutaceae bacterium]